MSEIHNQNGRQKWVLVVGATSGIARALVRELARHNFSLILAARDSEEMETIAADLRVRAKTEVAIVIFEATATGFVSEKNDDAFWNQALKICGEELHGVVLCHAIMPEQELAERDWKTSRAMIEINYASVVSLLNIAAAYFEERSDGFIAAIGSVAGDRGRKGNYIYGSTKAALSVLMQGVRQRLAVTGVSVITIKPGPIDTAMTFGMEKLPLLVPPERVARDILRAIRQKKEIIYTPAPWRIIMTLMCLVPEKLWKKMKF